MTSAACSRTDAEKLREFLRTPRTAREVMAHLKVSKPTAYALIRRLAQTHTVSESTQLGKKSSPGPRAKRYSVE